MAQEHRALIPALALVAASLLLAGCPSRVREMQEPPPAVPETPAGQAPAVPPATPPAPPPRPPAPPREIRLSPAAQSLVNQAQAAIKRGDLAAGSSTLDRALRIEPSNPLLWVEMGKLRLLEGDARQAETCGRKALALASGDPAAQRQSGRVLIDALRAQGRNQDAHEIEIRPYMR